MEVILSATFGMKTDSQTDPDDKLTNLARRAMNPPPWTNIALMVPFIGKMLAKKVASSSLGFGWGPMVDIAKDIIKKRRESGVAGGQRNVSFCLLQTDVVILVDNKLYYVYDLFQ